MTRFRFLTGFALALLATGLIAATGGANRFINGTEIPFNKTLVYTTGAQAITAGAVTATTVAASSTLSVTGAATLASTVSLTSAGNVAATGATGASATTLAYTINGVSATTGGLSVVLPTAATGRVVLVGNQSASTVSLYPFTGDAINAGAANAALSMSTAKSYVCGAVDVDHWICAGN